MSKKFFFIGTLALLGASLLLLGCPPEAEPDTDNEDPPEPEVRYIGTQTASASDLENMFKGADIIYLDIYVETVDGEVPAGKKLEVWGDLTKVLPGSELVVKGSVEVCAGAMLTATFVSGTAGAIEGAAGSVYGEGVVLLPYATNNADTGECLTYNKSTAARKAAGSVWNGTDSPVALTESGVVDIFTAQDGPPALTVYNLTGLAAAMFSAGKTLTLVGEDNTVTANLDATNAGTLIMDGILIAKNAITITGKESATITITINGMLNLGTGGTIAGKIINNGYISSGAASADIQKTLISTPNGSGTVYLTGTGNGPVGNEQLTLTQDVTISGTLKAPLVAVPFSGDKTIEVAWNGTLDFGAPTAAVTSIGATVVNTDVDNRGTVATATTSDKVLTTIMGVGGMIEATGAITALAGDFTVPKGVELSIVTGGAFATGKFTVTVEEGAWADFYGATFAEVNNISIAGYAIFDALAPANNVTVSGTLNLRKDLTLKKSLIISGTGKVVLDSDKKITLSDATNAKIVGGTAYEIVPADSETDGYLAVGTDPYNKVAFTATGIEGYIQGYDEDYNYSCLAIADLKSDPASAATLAFGGTAGTTLLVKGATTVGGVILDVSSKGKITVASGQKLTLGLGAGDDHIASGGIFTKAGGVTTINAVKANGVQSGTALTDDTAAGLGAAKIAATGAADSVQAASPASGVITGGTNTVIDKEDTFTVGANGAITVGHS